MEKTLLLILSERWYKVKIAARWALLLHRVHTILSVPWCSHHGAALQCRVCFKQQISPLGGLLGC